MNTEFLYSFSFISILSIICLYIVENVLKLPAVIGFLLAGILSSSSLLNVSLAIQKGNLLGDFGMLFLMFYMGMEFSYSHLKNLTSYIKPSCALFVSSALWIGIGLFIWQNFHISINLFAFISIVLCLSMASTAVTMELLSGSKNEYIMYTVITSLILQDLIVIILMIITSHKITEGIWYINLFNKIILPLIITVSYILLTENFLFKPVMRFLYHKQNRHILPILSICLVVISSYLSAINGISHEFGVFIIGMLIGDTEYKYSIISDIKPFQDIFLGLFFLVIGSTFDFQFFMSHWFLLTKTFLIIFLLKFIGIFSSSWLLNKKFYKSMILAIKLSNSSEIIFIILGNLYKNAFIDNFNIKFFTNVTILSFLFTPILSKGIYYLLKNYLDSVESNWKDNSYDVIIVGFSKSLEPIINIFNEKQIHYVIFEKNIAKLNMGKELGYHCVYGDIFNHQILSNINIKWNTTIFFNFSIMSHHINLLINFRKHFHKVKLIALANLESDSFAQRFNIEIIVKPYIEESLLVAKNILYNLNHYDDDLDLDIYINDFRHRWYDKNKKN